MALDPAGRTGPDRNTRMGPRPARAEDLVTLESLRPDDLGEVLAHQGECWRRELRWDHSQTSSLITRSLAARTLSGYGLRRSGRTLAYAYCLPAAGRSLIGAVHALPEAETEGGACLVLDRVLGYLVREAGSERIESQSLYFGAEPIAEVMRAWGARSYQRRFMTAAVAVLGRRLGRRAGVALRPVGRTELAAAAAVIHASFVGSPDAEMSACYRTVDGCRGFVEGVALRAGCGCFEERASWIAGDGVTRDGVILTSRVGDGVAHVVQLSVRPSAQGRGLGSRLLAAACDRLQVRGCRQLTLSVSDANARALAWYQDLGFTTVKPFEAWVWGR